MNNCNCNNDHVLDCNIKCDQCKKDFCINDINVCKNNDYHLITNHQPISMNIKIQIHMLLCNECENKCDVCNMNFFIKNNKFKLPKEILDMISDYI